MVDDVFSVVSLWGILSRVVFDGRCKTYGDKLYLLFTGSSLLTFLCTRILHIIANNHAFV